MTGLSRVTEGRGRQTEMEAAGYGGKTTPESGQDWAGLSRVTEGRGRQTEMEAAGQRVDMTVLDFPESHREGCGRQTEMEAAGSARSSVVNAPYHPPGHGPDR